MIDCKSRLGLLAVSAIAWPLVPSAHAQPVNDPALRGAIDIHSHLDPDGDGPGHNGRSMDVLDMARTAKEAGMRGFVIKMHYDQSADDAYWAPEASSGPRGLRRHWNELRHGRPEPGRDSADGGRQGRLGTNPSGCPRGTPSMM